MLGLPKYLILLHSCGFGFSGDLMRLSPRTDSSVQYTGSQYDCGLARICSGWSQYLLILNKMYRLPVLLLGIFKKIKPKNNASPNTRHYCLRLGDTDCTITDKSGMIILSRTLGKRTKTSYNFGSNSQIGRTEESQHRLHNN